MSIAYGLAAVLACTRALAAPSSPWKTAASTSLKETYDSNVFLQDTTPNSTISGAVQPRVGSLVTSVATALGFDYRSTATFNLAASYAPESVFYHSASGENFTTHRTGLNLGGQDGETTWTLQNSATWIDGQKTGLIFGGPGGVPAIGGIPLRDRRAAFIERSNFKLTCTYGRWLVRPVATAYFHDFRTVQSRVTCYENYIDRQELAGGLDLAYELFAKTRIVAGFRYARQDQFKLLGVDSPFDCLIRRYLVGLEGTPAPWLQLAVLAGPETRSFASGTPVGFDRNRQFLWIDATATLKLSPHDTTLVAVRRFAQPAFSSQSLYEDITYEISWRHTLGGHLAAGAGFRAYGGDWLAPVVREDWIITPSALLQYAVNPRCSVELTYLFDRVHSRVPNTAGREYRRALGAVSAKYAF